MLSTVLVTSGRILSAEEAKLASLIGMTIFNNGLQFIIGEDVTFRAMIHAARNVSRNYKLPGRETWRGPLLDNCFDNHIKIQHEKLLNGADIYGLHFQVDGATIKDNPLVFISWLGGFNYLCQSKILCTVQVTSQVVTVRMLNLLRGVSFIQ